MNALLPKLRDCRRGATAVEFAIISLLLIQLLVVCFEAMVAVSAWSTLQWACDEASRYAMTHQTASRTTIRQYAEAKATSAGYPASSGMSFVTSQAGFGGTDYMIIEGYFTHRFNLGPLDLGSVDLTAKSMAPLI